MKRAPIKQRKITLGSSLAEQDTTDMLVIRGPKDIKPPTPKEIQGMKNREFTRKNPFTNA